MNPLPRSAHRTLPAWFCDVAKARGPRTAMRWKRYGIWEDITWNSYADNVRAAGCGLVALGINRGDRVGIIANARPEWPYIDLGAQGVGAIAVGIYTTDAPRQVAWLANDSGARILFVENDEQLDKVMSVLDDMPAVECVVYLDPRGLHGFSHPKVMSFDDFLAQGRVFAERHPGRWEEEVKGARPDDVAIIIYTSGTTGPPKGAMLTHRNLIFQMGAMEHLAPGREGDDQLSFLPLSHIVERYFTVYRPLDHGAVVNIGEGMGALADNLREVAPQVMMAVPRIWEKLYSAVTMAIAESSPLGQFGYRTALNIGFQVADCRLAKRAPSAVLALLYALARLLVLNRVRTLIGMRRARLLISGAAPISPDLIRWYYALGLDMVEAYGQTECTGHATSYTRDEARVGTVGRAIAGTEVKLGDQGEILVKGPHVFAGYFNQPEKTAEVVRDGWLHTGDVGMFDGDGYLTVTDRLKDIIVTAGGKNITPSEIETRLKFSPYISDAVVIGDRRKYLTCLIMIDHDTVVKYAQDQNIPFTGFASLARSPEIRRLIEQEVAAVNRDFARVENIRRFELIDVQLGAEDEELTPTLKLKRKAVNERFRDLIEKMYEEA